ncbi:MAG TPA: YraN family protein [Acidimicrobiales bacterium]|nr:YraN family protein [Acidimicrobiales bacterium]
MGPQPISRTVTSARVTGLLGEAQAAAWYSARGYTVVARNWSCRDGEVDIIARMGRLTVFCEVKSRSSLAFGTPAEAVGFKKQARLRRLAARWFDEQAAPGVQAAPKGQAAPGAQAAAQLQAARDRQEGRRAGGGVRFDVACVLGDKIEVLEGAF